MNARNLGFVSSWHMLTRDKGWLKPVLVLTLVGWIPILGQIALLGYGMEWARLTAWGVDSAPKQRGVDYGKVLSTGGRAFLVTISMGIVVALILQVVFPGSLYLLVSGLTGGNAVSTMLAVTSGATFSLFTIFASGLMGSFLQTASLRSTLYDSFSAGWRLDRLFQMIGRDFGGFLHTFGVVFIGGLISGAYAFIVTLVCGLVAVGSLMSATAFMGISGSYMSGWHFILERLLQIGAGPLLLFLLCVIALTFIGGVISTAMSLVSMNAMGQWFCRFDVDRWGVSGDPLPADVPHRDGYASGVQSAPVPPVTPAGATNTDFVTEPSTSVPAEPSAHAAQEPAASPVEPSTPQADPVTPLSEDADIPVDPVVPLDAEEGSCPSSDAASCTDSSGESEQGSAEDSKEPILLGPITSDDEAEDK